MKRKMTRSTDAAGTTAPTERLQKLLARAGLGSRREIERWIENGEVTVNGEVAELGRQASASDRISVRGEPVSGLSDRVASTRILIYHKPEGEVTTYKDPEGRPTVFERLPRLRGERWLSVGRLDVNTTGILLFSNDGEFVHRLTHPSAGLDREYAVRVRGEVTQDVLESMLRGVPTDDGVLKFDDIRLQGGDGQNQWYHVVLQTGRYREVRRLWESQGLEVSRLIRVRYGPVLLPSDLQRGAWVELNGALVNELRERVGLAKVESAGPPQTDRRGPKPGRPAKRRSDAPRAPQSKGRGASAKRAEGTAAKPAKRGARTASTARASGPWQHASIKPAGARGARKTRRPKG